MSDERRCRTCLHFRPDEKSKPFGTCDRAFEAGMFLNSPTKYDPAVVHVWGNENGGSDYGMLVGPEFGCVHHEGRGLIQNTSGRTLTRGRVVPVGEALRQSFEKHIEEPPT